MSFDLLREIGWPTLAVLSVGIYFFLLGCKLPLLPKKMRGKVWVILVSIPLLLWGSSGVMLKSNQPSPSEFLVSELRKQVDPPVDLTDYMRLENITAEPGSVVYHISMAPDVGKAKKTAADLKKELFADACTNEEFLLGLTMGLNLEVRFTQVGVQTDAIVITPADCRQ